jgi:hypothetical protein
MMEWMSGILVGEMAGANEDFGLEVVGKCGWFLSKPQLPIQLSMIHMDQMIFSELSIRGCIGKMAQFFLLQSPQTLGIP